MTTIYVLFISLGLIFFGVFLVVNNGEKVASHLRFWYLAGFFVGAALGIVIGKIACRI